MIFPISKSVVKVVLWSRGGAHLTKPGWSKPHTHSNTTNLTLFRGKITLYRFNQGGGSYYCRGLKWEQGAEPPSPPHFNHCFECQGAQNQWQVSKSCNTLYASSLTPTHFEWNNPSQLSHPIVSLHSAHFSLASTRCLGILAVEEVLA